MLTKTFNNIKLTNTELQYVWMKNVQEDGKCYMLYRIIDLTNGFEYTGRKTASSFNELNNYTGSGSLISDTQERKPEGYFEMQVIAFFENSKDLGAAEEFVVTDEYCLRDDTYNVQPARKGGMGFCDTWYHDPIVGIHVRANSKAMAKMKRLGFVKGRSYSAIKKASYDSRGMKMWFNNTVVKLSDSNDIDIALSNGAEFINKRVWMHKPGQRTQSFLKGSNKNLLRPQASNIKNILKYRSEGWEFGLEKAC